MFGEQVGCIDFRVIILLLFGRCNRYFIIICAVGLFMCDRLIPMKKISAEKREVLLKDVFSSQI